MLVSAGKISLPDLERVSLDETSELLDYLEAEAELREKIDERKRRESEAQSKPPARR